MEELQSVRWGFSVSIFTQHGFECLCVFSMCVGVRVLQRWLWWCFASVSHTRFSQEVKAFQLCVKENLILLFFSLTLTLLVCFSSLVSKMSCFFPWETFNAKMTTPYTHIHAPFFPKAECTHQGRTSLPDV